MRRCGYGEESERQGFIGASKGLFIQSQNCRGIETDSSFCNAVGIWFINGADRSCDWCIDWLGLPVAQSLHTGRMYPSERQAVTRWATPGEHERCRGRSISCALF